jgi:NitT/TauT family transport system ATP-binding protein
MQPETTPVSTGRTLPDGQAMLSVRGLKKVYHTDGGDIEAVRNLTFDLKAGELACLVGPSGSGKTTLLKCISGLLAPTEGEVLLDGARVTGPPKKMAVVFQEYGRSLFPWMRVRENVELPLKNAGMGKAERDKLVDEALEAVGLDHVPQSYPWQLSGGMQQRASLCRALVHEPRMLLLDEPFGALDAFTREDLWNTLRDLWAARRFNVILVTHDLREAVYLADTVYVMGRSPGRIVAQRRIDLPRPRDLDLTYTQPFADIVHELRAHIGAQRQPA